MRHTFASLHIHAGDSVVELADQLGHAPAMTLDTYAHVIREFRGDERVSVEQQVLRARQQPR